MQKVSQNSRQENHWNSVQTNFKTKGWHFERPNNKLPEYFDKDLDFAKDLDFINLQKKIIFSQEAHFIEDLRKFRYTMAWMLTKNDKQM